MDAYGISLILSISAEALGLFALERATIELIGRKLFLEFYITYLATILSI